MSRRVLLVGATGVFGARLARLLASNPDLTLVIAARGRAGLERLAGRLAAEGARASLEVAVFDRAAPQDLAALRPWLVIDAAGPFQQSGFDLARAAIAARAHYVDLADARGFVAEFPGALDAAARAAGVLAVAGASSTPALSNAVLDELTAGWREVHEITVAICPGGQAAPGLSVVRAILSYAGAPVRVFAGGAWGREPGWSGLRRVRIDGLGVRRASLCETPDLDLLVSRFRPTGSARLLAGLESPVMQAGLWLLAWPVRLGWARSLAPLARPLAVVAGWIARFGSDRGGMLVEATGRDGAGRAVTARWSLVADDNAGPSVPAAAAAAMVRALASGRLEARGASACVGLLSARAILDELAQLPVRTRTTVLWPDHPTLLARVMGPDFERLPAAVRQVHAGLETRRFGGRGRARGSGWPPVRMARAVLGLPDPGLFEAVAVTIAPDQGGETWTRSFGARSFSSRLVSLTQGRFEERFGALRFRFEPVALSGGFSWRLLGLSLGPLPLPRCLAPKVRARTFADATGYRFSVLVAHPWLGVIFTYAGRLGGDQHRYRKSSVCPHFQYMPTLSSSATNPAVSAENQPPITTSTSLLLGSRAPRYATEFSDQTIFDS